jgi:glycosyltransferase involved in cell wall biosynthesis
MTPKVSVIIPVYNAEKFINDTLDCVLNQTLREIEVICVDDGSKDRSLELLNARAKTDDRLTVISQPNSGAGVARNNGLVHATGEYISWLDSDDLFERDMLEIAYNACKRQNADIGAFRCDMFDDETGAFSSGAWALRDEFLPAKQPFSWKDMPDRIFFAFVGWAWDKLFRREFVLENRLSFQALRTTNDMFFVFSALIAAERIITIDGVLAHQRRRSSDSLSVTREKSWSCFHEALDALEKYLRDRGVYGELEKCFINYCVHFSLWNLNTITGETYALLYNAIRGDYFPQWHIADRDDEFFYNKGEIGQARRIIEMPFAAYAAHMINSARKNAGARAELDAIKRSSSYRIGRAITYIPRLLKGRK